MSILGIFVLYGNLHAKLCAGVGRTKVKLSAAFPEAFVQRPWADPALAEFGVAKLPRLREAPAIILDLKVKMFSAEAQLRLQPDRPAVPDGIGDAFPDKVFDILLHARWTQDGLNLSHVAID